MSLFQNELDVASIDLNQRLKADIQHYFNATGYTVVSTETISKGLLGLSLSNLIPKEQYIANIVCHSPRSFKDACGLPVKLIPSLPTADFAQELAGFMAEKTAADVSVALLGINGIPKNDVLISRVFIGYSFNKNKSVKVLELSGSLKVVLEQSVVATLGFLQTLFLKYGKKIAD